MNHADVPAPPFLNAYHMCVRKHSAMKNLILCILSVLVPVAAVAGSLWLVTALCGDK